MTPAARAAQLRDELERTYGVHLPGAERLLERALAAATTPPSVSWGLPTSTPVPLPPWFGGGGLRMCPRSDRPCGLGCGEACALVPLFAPDCAHLRTAQGVGWRGGLYTVCLDCSQRIA